HGRRHRGAGARRVAARGGDPGRGAAPKAERRARRPCIRARGGTGVDRAVVSVPLFRWDVPGPYDVVFTTRAGGVSEGPFASLNLGRRTGDHVERVDENRRRLCAEVGADEDDLTLGYQTHSTAVNRAEAGSRGAPGDGLWTAAEQAARQAGASTVDRVDLCTRCREDLFFSERRTGRPRGTQGVLGLVR